MSSSKMQHAWSFLKRDAPYYAELLAVGLRPYHLPMVDGTIGRWYLPPSAGDPACYHCCTVHPSLYNPTSACSIIHTTISKLQTQHHSALIIKSGDFNHVTLDRVLPTFKQYVSCHTREERTLDLMLTSRMHTSPLLSPLWAGQIITWFSSNPAICLF